MSPLLFAPGPFLLAGPSLQTGPLGQPERAGFCADRGRNRKRPQKERETTFLKSDALHGAGVYILNPSRGRIDL